MPLLSVANVAHAYGSFQVLSGASLTIEPGEKIGLVGRNGSGKTSLMKIMQGAIRPDSGQVSLQRNSRVGYLSQDPSLDPDDTLRDAAEGAFAELHRLHVELHELYHAMESAQGEELDRLLRRQAVLDAQVQTAGGYAIDHKIDATLHGLGFTDDQFSLKVSNLSGGQKGRLGLARLLLEEPDLLLLDEPTNHLDIDGREWLEQFLSEEYKGAVLLVSHDRWLLDRVVKRIIETERGVIREYPGNYHAFLDLRQQRMLTEARVYDKQIDRIRAEEQFIQRYKAGQRAKQAKGRLSRLERFKQDELVERPMELEVMRLELPPAPRSGDQVLIAEGITKAYGDRVLFRNLDLKIMRGERIGIVGPNGAGKSTLIKTILGEIEPDQGTVRLGSRLSIGFYRQLHEHLDMSLTVWQYLQSVIVGLDGSARGSEQQARDLAGAFLFSGDDQERVLGTLSGGERSRAVLAGLLASAKNLLILDEPTNHLDLQSAERLEQALSRDGGYEGTLLLISHDRALLESTCDQLIVLDGNGNAEIFPGSISGWLDRRHKLQQAAQRARNEAAKPKAKTAVAPTVAAAPKNPLARLSMDEIEKRIEQCEKMVIELDKQLMDPDVYLDAKKLRDLQMERDKVDGELEPLNFEWSRRADG